MAAGVWILRIVVEGKSTHCGNRPLAIRPGGPGDEIGVNALEKALDVVEALQRLEEQWGISKRHPCFSPGFFTIGPNLLHADAGVSFPAYFPTAPPSSTSSGTRRKSRPRRWRARSRATCSPPAGSTPGCATTRPRSSGSTTGRPWRRRGSTSSRRRWRAVTRRRAASGCGPPSPERPVNFGAASDGSFYEVEGIPAVVYGPGDLKLAHGRDEHVLLDDVATAAKALAAAVVDWCGTKP